MALNKANITWPGKQIAKMAGNGTIRLNNIIQRSYVWEQQRKSELIHSMIEGYPIPPFYARRVDGKVYDFLDGKQRINAIKGYIDGEYCLVGLPEIELVHDDGSTEMVNVEGRYINDLPEEFQDTIRDYYFTIYYFENVTPDQIRIMFRKLNNGKPLSAKDRNIANCNDIASVSNLGEHEFFTKILTEKGFDNRKQIPLVMKMYMMLFDYIENVSFESKAFNQAIQDVNMTDEQKNTIIEVLDRYLEIYNAIQNREEKKVAKFLCKKMGTEVHMISLIPFIKKSIDEDVSVDMMAGFIKSLFLRFVADDGKIDGKYFAVSTIYNDACTNGSAKNANVIRRNDELKKAWDEYFEADDSDNAVPESAEEEQETNGEDDPYPNELPFN